MLIIVIICIYYSSIYHHVMSHQVAADSNGVQRQWNVVSSYKNDEDAARLLSHVNSQMIEFMRVLKKKYHLSEVDEDILEHDHKTEVDFPNDTYQIVEHLLRNYNPDEFYENDPRVSTDTSYTINKGASMHLCLRNKLNPQQLANPNDLLFVLLHESAHIANYNDTGHTPRFWQVFKFILHEATLSGVYTPTDYRSYPMVYCGLYVDYQPLFDSSLPNLWE